MPPSIWCGWRTAWPLRRSGTRKKGQFGCERRLRYVFFDGGGHVAIAKRYREYARQIGLLKTLAEKRQENPDVDLLVGAVNIWNWDADPGQLVTQLRAAGIERILWSRGGSANALRTLNDMKVLTSRYDIYQDTMNPSNFPFLRGADANWTTAGWPADIIRQANGGWSHAWGVEGSNGTMYDFGMLSDSRALDYARARIPPE